MSSNRLHITLLRPAVLHILRAAGFNAARPLAAEALVDITARYLGLVASKVAEYSWSNHENGRPSVTDVRMSLQEVGAFYPERDPLEEQLSEEDDMRGFEGFVKWFESDAHRELRRIAGLSDTPTQMMDIETGGEPEDYLTVLKKKHSKTGEESRFQGTVLGKPAEHRPSKIEGGKLDDIRGWQTSLHSQKHVEVISGARVDSPDAMSVGSSPLSEI